MLTFVEFSWILLLMRFLFLVPIHGSVLTLLAMAIPFLLTMLGLGLWISTRVQTRDAAMQMAMGTVMPVDLPLGLHLPDRLDADALLDRLAADSDDLDDRRRPRRHPPRRRLGRAGAERPDSLDHGHALAGRQREAVPQAIDLNSENISSATALRH